MIALVGSDGRIRYGGCATHQRPRPFDGRVVERAARLLATLIRFSRAPNLLIFRGSSEQIRVGHQSQDGKVAGT